jgi:signal transduction histidine kinase
MPTAASSTTITTPPRSGLQRVLAELPITVVVSTLLAALITLVIGKPEAFLENLVFSVMIGAVAFVLLNGARLLFWDLPVWGWRQWVPFLALAVVAAPIAHFTGTSVAGVLLDIRTPTLSEYPSRASASMILFTLGGTSIMTVLLRHRERLRRSEAEHAAARLRAEVQERQALQAQLRLMQAQIEPHMLFNTLANLQGLIALDPERAGEMLDQLIQYLRATLSVSRAEQTTLEEEFNAMRAYLGLMGVRMGERLTYRLELPPALRSARLPTMLLQPLVENAIVHGLEPKVDGGEIVIAAREDGGRLTLTVRDTGLGLGLGQPHGRRSHGHSGGVGVATTRERLDGLYGPRATLDLAPAQPHGTLARLTLPLETA